VKLYVLFLVALYSVWGTSTQSKEACSELKIIANEIDGFRKNRVERYQVEEKITELNGILSGQKYGVDLGRRATPAEREIAWEAVLTQHLVNKELGIPLNIYQFEWLANPIYIRHVAVLYTMHIAASTFATKPGDYFLDLDYLANTLGHALLNHTQEEPELHNYFSRIEISSTYVKAALGERFMESVVKLIKGYPDIPYQWLVNSYIAINKETLTTMRNLQPYSEFWPLRLNESAVDTAMIFPTPAPIFEECTLRGEQTPGYTQDWFEIGHHWVIVRQDQKYKTVLDALKPSKYLHALHKILEDRGWILTNISDPEDEQFLKTVALIKKNKGKDALAEKGTEPHKTLLEIYDDIYAWPPSIAPESTEK
jgi:hypothetical protein